MGSLYYIYQEMEHGNIMGILQLGLNGIFRLPLTLTPMETKSVVTSRRLQARKSGYSARPGLLKPPTFSMIDLCQHNSISKI